MPLVKINAISSLLTGCQLDKIEKVYLCAESIINTGFEVKNLSLISLPIPFNPLPLQPRSRNCY
jgi:hypothetical protein